ncbi:alpha/beta hydrolase [Rheinheimera sp. WS51]|uniref:alpha/beta hydrolase n=1 Tax=Rheinheimera sp. WS51 TaxID=3425886 RepID=UPI003D91AC89
MQLTPWSFTTRMGFTLRGYRSEPSGKPVLHVLHGNGFCSAMYQPMLQQLAADFDLFLSDAQGHGDSDHGGSFIGWNLSAEFAKEAWLAHANLYPNVATYGLGHSFGGVLTALIHSQQPSPFNAIILLDPVLFTPAMITVMATLSGIKLYHKNPLAKAALRRRQHWPDRDTALSYFKNRGLFKHWQPESLAAYIDHALKPSAEGLSLKCLPEREADIFSSYPKQLWQQLAQPCPPVFVLYAKQSYSFITSAVTKWQKRNSAVSIQQVDGDHCFMQQHPKASADKIRLIINSISK